jgi:predicted ATP-grasp superfamily ATP-dependent carboligase
MAMKNIAIIFGESVPAPEIAWSLLDAGFSVTVYIRENAITPIRRLKGIEYQEITAPETDLRKSIAQLQESLVARSIYALFPLDDDALALSKELSPAEGFSIWGPHDSAVDCALNKSVQFHLAMESGFSVPDFRIISTSSDARGLMFADDTSYVVKPSKVVLLHDCKLKHSKNLFLQNKLKSGFSSELLKWIEQYGEVILQEKKIGVGEGLFGVAKRGKVYLPMAHRRTRMMNPQGSGASACRTIDVDGSLLEAAERFLGRLEWNGMFMLEFLRDSDNRAWFMELNGRPWGSLSLAIGNGYDYPNYHAKIYTSEQLPKKIYTRSFTSARHLGRDLIHFGFMLKNTLRGEASFVDLFKSFIGVFVTGWFCRQYYWRPSAPLYFIRDAYCTIRRKI